jgi:hypothetical protein
MVALCRPVSSGDVAAGTGTIAVDCEEYERSATSGVFRLQGKYVFVTYNRSRVMDHLEFYRLLQDSIRPRMPHVGAGRQAGVKFYGAREWHETGEPHYHVVMAFDKPVHWRDARAKLAVMVDVDGESKADTMSIRIKTHRRPEPLGRFLDFCQAYIGKMGPEFCFGEWIEDEWRRLARDEANHAMGR